MLIYYQTTQSIYTQRKCVDAMLDKKGGMKSEIKITGLIKSGGQLITIKKGEEGWLRKFWREICEVMQFVC